MRRGLWGALLLPVLAGAAAGHVLVRPGDLAGAAVPSVQSTRDIPPAYLALYRRAAPGCRGMRWELLAAVGRIESDHGRARAVGVASGENPWGAAGPMQFLASTWKQWGTPQVNDRYDPALAIPAAARFLCALGAGTDEVHAASSYYAGPYATGKARAQGDAYAADVERQAVAYATGGSPLRHMVDLGLSSVGSCTANGATASISRSLRSRSSSSRVTRGR